MYPTDNPKQPQQSPEDNAMPTPAGTQSHPQTSPQKAGQPQPTPIDPDQDAIAAATPTDDTLSDIQQDIDAAMDDKGTGQPSPSAASPQNPDQTPPAIGGQPGQKPHTPAPDSASSARPLPHESPQPPMPSSEDMPETPHNPPASPSQPPTNTTQQPQQTPTNPTPPPQSEAEPSQPWWKRLFGGK